MSDKTKPNPLNLKELMGKESPSTLLKFILAILSMLIFAGSAILYAPIADYIKYPISGAIYLSFFYILLTTYHNATKDPLKYISTSNTIISFLNSNLGDSYKQFINPNQQYDSNSNAPLEIEEEKTIKLIEPKKMTLKQPKQPKKDDNTNFIQ